MLSKKIGHKNDLGLLLMRIAAGIIFAAHGLQKLDGGLDGFAGFLGQLAIPFPEFFAWVVALVELVGGIFLILGVFSRMSALLLSIVMLVTITKVKSTVGLIAEPGAGAGAELDLALLSIVVGVLLLGPGYYSIEKSYFGKELA